MTAPVYRCAACGEQLTSWAAAERHADTHGGATVWWVGKGAA